MGWTSRPRAAASQAHGQHRDLSAPFLKDIATLYDHALACPIPAVHARLATKAVVRGGSGSPLADGDMLEDDIAPRGGSVGAPAS